MTKQKRTLMYESYTPPPPFTPEPHRLYRRPDPADPARVLFELYGADVTAPLIRSSVAARAAGVDAEIALWVYYDQLPADVVNARPPQLVS